MTSSKVNFRVARRLVLVAALALLAACGNDNEPATPAAGPAIPSQHAQFITDAQGRALILHGINVTSSAKDDPQRMPWITQADAVRLQHDFGFNVVRFLIFWDAIEPSPGQYDDTYLDRVAERVDWFANAGVYVVLDMHQDVYGHFDDTGKPLGFDGAPNWAARTDGLPHSIQNPWSLTYVQPGVRRAFDNFWNVNDSNADLQQHYAAAWAHIAARFKDDPWVLGYDLMNEPFAGSAFAGDFGGIPIGNEQNSKTFEQNAFHQFYDHVVAAIRAVDADGWIFYEPLAFPCNNGGPSYLGKINDPRHGENRLVYFPHLYAILPELNSHYDPSNSPELDKWIVARKNEIPDLKTPLLIGEFGLPWDGGDNPLGYLRKILDNADQMTSGWAYWTYDPGDWAPVTGSDLHESPNANVLVRAYPQRVAGTPVAYGYDVDTRVLDLTFVESNRVSGPTQLYIPARRFYPDGWHLEVDDATGSWSSQWDSDREVVSITTPHTGKLHHLRVVPGK
ncbi:MAG TPA: cellulase family glycosylhydrolase [Candidatus Acidoferrales bacterium]|nr:cellulase family glycosylhydrolase [Candidatus Acidoferrales bacterium]